MPTPTEINLNDALPAAPAGEENIVWQAGTAYPDPNNPEVPLRDVSAYAPGAAIQKSQYTYAADTGAADAYAVALSPAPPSLVAGFTVIFKAANANTGESTLAVNGGSAKFIKKSGVQNLAAGDIAAGQIIAVVYDGTYFQMVGGSASGGARGNVELVTASIAYPGYETGSVALGKCSVLYKVVASDKCRIRLYSTAAGRDDDVARIASVAADWGVGLLVELVLDTTALLTFLMQPPALCENLDGTPATDIYYTVANMKGSSSTFTITFTRLPIE